jgi:hypothetical protein
MSVALCLVGALAAAPSEHLPRQSKKFSSRECVAGRWHHTEYNTVGLSDEVFVDLDSMGGLEAVQCDLDGSQLKLKYHSEVTAAEYYLRFHDWNDHFIVGGAKWNCSIHQTGNPGLIIRRIVGASEDGQYLNVRAATARYDEIYEDADISFKTDGACDEGVRASQDKEVCVGYNSQCTGTASVPIPLYTSKNGDVSVACSDCFIDFTMDVFVDVKIRGWKVANLSTGFRNVAVNASTVLDAKSGANWNTGLDKTLPVLQNEYLVDFKVGPVPFMIFFDLPVELKAEFQFTSAAEATVGAHVNLGLGDAYVSWDPVNHWTHAAPAVTLDASPAFATSASFDATGSLSAIPTLTAHFDKILSYQVKATPELDMEITGSEASKNVCLDSTYAVDVASVTELDINIPWANIAKDWTWNKDIYSSGTKTLVQKCVSL